MQTGEQHTAGEGVVEREAARGNDQQGRTSDARPRIRAARQSFDRAYPASAVGTDQTPRNGDAAAGDDQTAAGVDCRADRRAAAADDLKAAVVEHGPAGGAAAG